MILYNVAQARTNTLAHNKKLHNIIDTIDVAVMNAVEEGKFTTGELSISTEELEGNEAFVKGYFESLGYKCSCEVCKSKGRVSFEISWY